MRFIAKHDSSQNAGAPHVRSATSEDRDDTVHLILSPMEWKEVRALTHFAQCGLVYDCAAPYVTQVFVYDLSQPEELQDDEDLQAAFSTVADMAETIPADGTNGGDVTLGLPKEEMRQLFVILNIAAGAEEQAAFLYNGGCDGFHYPFPDLTVPPSDYVKAFDSLLMSLHHDKSMVIDVNARDKGVPQLDAEKLSPELRTYLEGAIKNLRAQHPEIYADDTRTIEIQTDELIDKLNSESLRGHKALSQVGNPENAPSNASRNPFDDSELRARVEEQGGTISAALTADQLRSQLPAGQWEKITNIDPELIKAERERQRTAFTPNLRRYNLERWLAKALLTDERIAPYMLVR
jgi:hypothetical protein